MTRTIVTFVTLLAVTAPAAAQTAAIHFPASLVISAHELNQAAQTPAPPPPSQPIPGQTGPRVPLTIDEAIKLALDHNLDISVQRYNQQTFDATLAGLRAVYSPTLTSTVSTQSTRTTSTDTTNGSVSGATINTDTALWNGGITQAVPWHVKRRVHVVEILSEDQFVRPEVR